MNIISELFSGYFVFLFVRLIFKIKCIRKLILNCFYVFLIFYFEIWWIWILINIVIYKLFFIFNVKGIISGLFLFCFFI